MNKKGGEGPTWKEENKNARGSWQSNGVSAAFRGRITTCSSVAATGKTDAIMRETQNAEADGCSTDEEVNGEESPTRDDRQNRADWWSRDWWSTWRSEASSSWEVSTPFWPWWTGRISGSGLGWSWREPTETTDGGRRRIW